MQQYGPYLAAFVGQHQYLGFIGVEEQRIPCKGVLYRTCSLSSLRVVSACSCAGQASSMACPNSTMAVRHGFFMLWSAFFAVCFYQAAYEAFHAGQVALNTAGERQLVAGADEVVLRFFGAEVFVTIEVVGEESYADFGGDEPAGEGKLVNL